MKKLNDLFYSFLQVAASTQKLGINLIRISILIIFVWIGGLIHPGVAVLLPFA